MDFNPSRLELARKQKGLTQSKLANLVGVDARSIRSYESGDGFGPSDQSLQRISQVLDVEPGFFYLDNAAVVPEIGQISFRALSKLSAIKRDMARGQGALGFEFMQWLEERFELPEFSTTDAALQNDPESAALALRASWGLGSKPIPNMVHLLEAKGVRVLSLNIESKEVDAFCTWRNETPFVFLNVHKSAARARFDAAHELGHIVLHRHGESSGKAVEKEANDFASAFLMPKSDVLAAAPRTPTVSKLMKAKKRWGVSAIALLYRMKTLKVVSDWQYSNLVRKLSTAGLRSRELDDEKREDSAVLNQCFRALTADGIGLGDVAKDLCVSRGQLKSLMFGLAPMALEGGLQGSSGRKPVNHSLKLVVDNN